LCENIIRSRIEENDEFSSYWAVNKPFISKVKRRKAQGLVSSALELDPGAMAASDVVG
jgi:hypothetical protein